MFPDLMRDDVFRLETQRLWLRWPRAADAVVIGQLAGDKAVAEMTAHVPHPYPPGAAAEFVLKARAGNLAGDDLSLVLAPKQRPLEAIGCIGLHRIGGGEAMLGYWLGRPFWGQGLMSEAARALIDVAFRTTDVSVIAASARPGNVRSQRVLESSGFRRSGVGVEQAPARGGPIPVERFLLRRSQWARSGSADAEGEPVIGARMMQTA